MTTVSSGFSGCGATAGGLALDARSFLVSAEHLLNIADGALLPTYFLFARSIELSLKSVLLAAGVSPVVVRAAGHDLRALYDHALSSGLAPLSAQEAGMFDLLGEEYRSTRIAYRDTDGKYCLPPLSVVEDIARRLVTVCDEGGITTA